MRFVVFLLVCQESFLYFVGDVNQDAAQHAAKVRKIRKKKTGATAMVTPVLGIVETHGRVSLQNCHIISLRSASCSLRISA